MPEPLFNWHGTMRAQSLSAYRLPQASIEGACALASALS